MADSSMVLENGDTTAGKQYGDAVVTFDRELGAQAQAEALPGSARLADSARDTARYESQGLLPVLKIDETDNKPFVPGYNRREADKYYDELTRENTSSDFTASEWDFLDAYNMRKLAEEGGATDLDLGDGSRPTENNEAESQPKSEGSLLKAGTQQTKFELGLEGEETIWRPWQERMNKTVFNKLENQLYGLHLPPDLNARVDYKIDNKGGYSWKLSQSSHNSTYDRAIEKTMNDVFRYHPELLKFPEGTSKDKYERYATFNTGKSASYATGQTEREFRKY